MNQPASDVIVNAGCLLLFHGQPHPQDVLDSTLYLQLAASKKHSRFAEHAQWQQTWLRAAQRFGWITRASESVRQPPPCLSPATFWDWAGALRPGWLSEALLERSEAMLRRCPVTQPAGDMLAAQVLGPGATTLALQIGLVDIDASLVLMQLHFNSRSALGREQLFGLWSAETVKGNIAFSVHHLVLAEPLYAPLRDAFAQALRDRRPGLVCPMYSQGAP